MDSMSAVLLSGTTTESVTSREVSETPCSISSNTPGLGVSCSVSPELHANSSKTVKAAIIFIRTIIVRGTATFLPCPINTSR